MNDFNSVLLVGIFFLNAAFVIVALFSIYRQQNITARRSKLQFAREFVTTVFEFQALFHSTRTPLIDTSEYYHRPRDAGETHAEKERLDERYALKHRVHELNKLMPQLDAFSWEAQVILGKDYSESIDELRKIADDLNGAIDRYFSKDFLKMVEEGKLSAGIFEEVYDRIYGFSADEFGTRMKETVEQLSKSIRKTV